MKTHKQVIGKQGEDLACELYKKDNFTIKDRNYLRKWGELDIIATKNGKLFFIEVKTVTRSYICNSSEVDVYKAEINMHAYKARRLKRAIQTYLLDMRFNRRIEWQFDLVTVVLDREDLSLLKIERIENLIL